MKNDMREKYMKTQAETEKEGSNLKPESLTDLPVGNEQADETKAGTVVTDYTLLECRFRDSQSDQAQ